MYHLVVVECDTQPVGDVGLYHRPQAGQQLHQALRVLDQIGDALRADLDWKILQPIAGGETGWQARRQLRHRHTLAARQQRHGECDDHGVPCRQGRQFTSVDLDRRQGQETAVGLVADHPIGTLFVRQLHAFDDER